MLSVTGIRSCYLRRRRRVCRLVPIWGDDADGERACHRQPPIVGDLVVDLAAKRVTRTPGPGQQPGLDIRLTPTEWHLLAVLLRHPGKLLSQRQLLTEVWGPGYTEAAGNLRLYMAQLRRKLEPGPARPRWLITEPGMGYRYQPGPAGEGAVKNY